MQGLPDFIGMGVIKCGTTWTFKQLQHHPQVCAPIKEAHFFDWHRWSPRQYRKIFGECDNQIRGEWTPEYFTTPGVPPRIKKMIPDVKLLCLLRNPADRAWSNYKSALTNGHISESRGFLNAFFNNYPRNNLKGSTLKERGMYWQHLNRWFGHFPREQMRIMFYDDLVNDPVQFMQGIYKWLKIDDTFVSPVIYKYINSNKQSYKHLVLPPKDRKQVVDFYLPSVEKLEQKMGILLPKWKV